MDGQLPAAGWYADPADAQSERWWDNTQWTEHTRPLAPPVEQPSIPQFAGAPSAGAVISDSGIPQFAPAAQPAWAQGDFGMSASSGTGGAASGITADPRFGGPDPYSQAPANPAVNAGWYSQSNQPLHGPPPTNTPALVSFILSLVGVGLVALILGFIGLKKAREFEAQGLPPVGRKLAAWGIGIAITFGLIGSITAIVFGSAIFAIIANGGYDRDVQEAAISDQLAQAGDKPISVICPESIPHESGATFECTAYMDDATSEVVTVKIH
jgi:hypothetical protein